MESYEQKYREALGRMMESLYGGLYGGLHGKTKEEAEKYFTELKESEDERVKKELIELISCMHDADPRKKGWIAWLERQGETFTKKDVEDAYLQGVCDAKQELEKQGEPFDDNIITRDDEILQAISIGLTDAEKDLGWSDFGGLPIEEIHAWLEKQGIYKVWTNNDYDKIKSIEYLLHEFDNHNFDDWFNSLKQRMEGK